LDTADGELKAIVRTMKYIGKYFELKKRSAGLSYIKLRPYKLSSLVILELKLFSIKEDFR
jgi:hypothetical protein